MRNPSARPRQFLNRRGAGRMVRDLTRYSVLCLLILCFLEFTKVCLMLKRLNNPESVRIRGQTLSSNNPFCDLSLSERIAFCLFAFPDVRSFRPETCIYGKGFSLNLGSNWTVVNVAFAWSDRHLQLSRRTNGADVVLKEKILAEIERNNTSFRNNKTNSPILENDW